MKILVLLLSICPTLTAFAQTPETSVRPQPFIRIERVGGTTANSFFVFTTADRHYTVRQDGLVESDFAELKRRRTFQMKMGPGGRLKRLYIAEFQDDLLMAYEVTDGNSGWAYVARLDQKARKFRWTTPFGGINPGPGLIEDSSVYVTAQNFLAKLDLQTGDFIWQSEVKQKSAPAFSEFLLPEIHDQRAIFRENGQRKRVIEVDKVNGENMKLAYDNAHRP
jgi:outer membrane protein assembly factor BamB